MPTNSAEYQKKYRQSYNKRMRNVTITIPIPMHREFEAYAKSQGLSISALMREATDVQIRQARLQPKEIINELKELRFLISNISNNVNQMAHHSNRLRTVVDENAVFSRLQELDELVTNYVSNRLNQTP